MLRSKVADLALGTVAELFLEEAVAFLVFQTWLRKASLGHPILLQSDSITEGIKIEPCCRSSHTF